MKSYLSITALVLFLSASYSDDISVQNVYDDIIVCQDALTKLNLQFEYFSFLTDLIDSIADDKISDSTVEVYKQKSEKYLLVLEDLGERGVYLQTQVNNLNGTSCSPCIKSGLGHFSKKIVNLQYQIKQSISEIEDVLLIDARQYASTFIRSVKEMLEINNVKTGADESEISEKLKVIEKQLKDGDPQKAMKKAIEVLHAVY